MCYCPTPTLHLNLALTGDDAFLLSAQKTHTVRFISILNYGDTENVLINHLLLVIPMSYPCHYTNLCPHKPHKHAHTHTHSHSHSHSHTHTHTRFKVFIHHIHNYTEYNHRTGCIPMCVLKHYSMSFSSINIASSEFTLKFHKEKVHFKYLDGAKKN